MSVAKHSSWRDRLAGILFVAFLVTPLVMQALRAAEGGASGLPNAELRVPNPPPTWRWNARAIRDYPARFDAWYRDAFGLREPLLATHNRALFRLLGVSPGDQTIAAAGDWLVFTLHRELESFRGEDPLSTSEIDAWRDWLEARTAWLAERGIAACFALAPYKSAIYPERVPDRLGPPGESRLEGFLARIERTSDATVVDFGAALREARAAWDPALVYYPLGTHWTPLGAFEGARALVAALIPEVAGLRPLERADHKLVPCTAEGDSWAGRLYLEGLLQQPCQVVRPRSGPFRARRVERRAGIEVWEHEDRSLPKAILIHDSFGDALKLPLAQSFSRLVLTRDDWPVELFEAEQPDVVLYVRAEHMLIAHPPDLNPLLEPGELRERFEAGLPVWKLEPSRAERQLQPEGSLELRWDGPQAGLALVHHAFDDTFSTPSVAWPGGRLPALRAVLDCDQAGSFDVFYQTAQEPSFDARRGFHQRLVEGRNEFILVLSVGGLQGELRIRPSLRAGTTRLHALELRAL